MIIPSIDDYVKKLIEGLGLHNDEFTGKDYKFIKECFEEYALSCVLKYNMEQLDQLKKMVIG